MALLKIDDSPAALSIDAYSALQVDNAYTGQYQGVITVFNYYPSRKERKQKRIEMGIIEK